MSSGDDDDDVGQMWRDVRTARQHKKRSNKQLSFDALREARIPFIVKNQGLHLIVADAWDFWPTTGLWIERRPTVRGHKRQGRGVLNLISVIAATAPKT